MNDFGLLILIKGFKVYFIGQQSYAFGSRIIQGAQNLIQGQYPNEKAIFQKFADQSFYELAMAAGFEVLGLGFNACYPAQVGWGGYLAGQIFWRVRDIYLLRMGASAVDRAFGISSSG